MNKILNKNYDLQGLEISRIAKMTMIGKLLPLGNLRGGPEIRHLLILNLLHHYGYFMYLFLARYGQHLAVLRRIAARLRPY
jgi:hypothetical protein